MHVMQSVLGSRCLLPPSMDSGLQWTFPALASMCSSQRPQLQRFVKVKAEVFHCNVLRGMREPAHCIELHRERERPLTVLETPLQCHLDGPVCASSPAVVSMRSWSSGIGRNLRVRLRKSAAGVVERGSEGGSTGAYIVGVVDHPYLAT
ncbi:hypothetical protein BHM03_00057554 [Ensete ventricosum]|nr:hypothetical protein BHM03_00057554 [Ensete ventricosum]